MQARYLLAAGLVLAALPAHAQSLSVGVEAASDERRRGISWSGGDAAASADISAGVAGIDASARVVTLRDAPRHGGADAVADLELGKRVTLGLVDLKARVIGHVFAGGTDSLDYVELGGTGGFSLGPLQLTAGASYAPDQRAIGGDNLYLFADANAGIPLTPITLRAGIGRSSGSIDDPLRAARLRPGGTYTDWRLGVEHVTGPLTLGLDYLGTDIDRRTIAASPFADGGNAGDRVVARARVSF